MSLQNQFEEAQVRVKTLSKAPSNEVLLDLYSLFKQGTLGDASGKRPGMLNMVKRAKFDAWAARKGTSKDAAMQAYVDLVEKLLQND